MSNLIKKIIKESIREYLSERYTSLPNKIVLLSTDGLFLLYDIINKNPIGYISFGFYPKIKSFTVGGIYSEHGYGPFLYECAMTYVYPNGLSMSRDSTTSDDALNVWRKFETRNDVKKERMYSDEITHKKEDWLESDFLGDNPEYRQKIFDLEDTRFYYNFGKDKLIKLIQRGKDYMAKNNISEKNVEYMSWDLES